MYSQYAQKADYTERLRRSISPQVTDVRETQRADTSFTALSYQSRSHPNRHVWIETDEQGMTLDNVMRLTQGQGRQSCSAPF